MNLRMSLLVAVPLLLASLPEGRTSPPPDDPLVELGRLLFWDPVLSGPRDVACATCHHPDHGWADGRPLSLGTGAAGLGPQRADVSGGTVPPVRRNSPTILNTAFNGVDGGRGRRATPPAPTAADQARAPMFWDSRTRSLEAQALEPLRAFEEMRGHTWSEEVAVDSALARLRGIPEYVERFARAFGEGEPVSAERLGRAIAAFERTLVAMNGPFDRFRAGDSTALTPQQRRGLQAFQRVGCDNCHRGVMFSDFELHAEGVRESALLATPDAGAGRFRFRTPSLRNVALTAPYMHNGELATLEDVLRFYQARRSENPNVGSGGRGGRGGGGAQLAGQFRRLRGMSDRDLQDIVAFLEALTDPEFERTVPDRVPSGLPPGGRLQAP